MCMRVQTFTSGQAASQAKFSPQEGSEELALMTPAEQARYLILLEQRVQKLIDKRHLKAAGEKK